MLVTSIGARNPLNKPLLVCSGKLCTVILQSARQKLNTESLDCSSDRGQNASYDTQRLQRCRMRMEILSGVRSCTSLPSGEKRHARLETGSQTQEDTDESLMFLSNDVLACNMATMPTTDDRHSSAVRVVNASAYLRGPPSASRALKRQHRLQAASEKARRCFSMIALSLHNVQGASLPPNI